MALPLENNLEFEPRKTVDFLDKFIKTYGVFPVIGSSDDYLSNERVRTSGKKDNIVILNPDSAMAKLFEGQIPKVHELINVERADNFPKITENDSKNIFYMSQKFDKLPKEEKEKNKRVSSISKLNQIQTIINVPQKASSEVSNNGYNIQNHTVQRYTVQSPEFIQYKMQYPIVNDFNVQNIIPSSSLESKIFENKTYIPEAVRVRRACPNYYRVRRC